MDFQKVVEKQAADMGYTLIEAARNGYWVLVNKDDEPIGEWKGLFSVAAVLRGLPEAPPPKPKPAVTAEWKLAAPEQLEIIPICSNCNSESCTSLLVGDERLVCVVGPCPRWAGCHGACGVHLADIRIHGDLTSAAAEKTEKLIEAGKWDKIVTLNELGIPVNPIKSLFPSYKSTATRVPAPTPAPQQPWPAWETFEDLEMVADLLGLQLAAAGNGALYLILNEDGEVILKAVGLNGVNRALVGFHTNGEVKPEEM